MIQVHGSLDGVPYRVVLTGRGAKPVEGSKHVAALVNDAIREGREVLVAPTGPRVKVQATDATSILHLLTRSGQVLTVTGDVPAATPLAEGVVH